ncbi:DUF7940 domain-containing protein [Afipia sp. TerB]
MTLQLLHNWRDVLKRAWSVRLSLLAGAVIGLFSVWPAFQDLLPAWLFGLLAVGMSVAIVIARITKQPGIE